MAYNVDETTKSKYVLTLNELRLKNGWKYLQGIVIIDRHLNPWDVDSILTKEVCKKVCNFQRHSLNVESQCDSQRLFAEIETMIKEIFPALYIKLTSPRCIIKKYTTFEDLETIYFKNRDHESFVEEKFYPFLNAELEFLYIEVIVFDYESLGLDKL